MRIRNLLYTAYAALFLFKSVFGDETVRISNIEMTMTSDVDSNPDKFPVEVLAKIDEFLRMILDQEYGDKFKRLSLSIISEGITAVGSRGFIDKMDLTGSAYFNDGGAPSFDEMTDIIGDAFNTMNDVFMEILSESPDSFLSEITFVEVSVEKHQVKNDESEDSDEGSDLKVWIIVVVVAVTAVCSLFLFCFICICCLGDVDDEGLDLKQQDTDEHQPSRGTQKSSIDDEEDEMQGSERLAGEEMSEINISNDENSLFSQDSSKFTYNPTSVTSEGAQTFRTYGTDGIGDYDAGTWKQSKANALPGLDLPFGHDISAIGGGFRNDTLNDSLFLSESDTLSPTATLGEMSGMSASGMSEYNGGEQLKMSKVSSALMGKSKPHTLKIGTSHDVLDDLDDLSKQVDAHRRIDGISPVSKGEEI